MTPKSPDRHCRRATITVRVLSDETFNEIVLGTTYDLTPSLFTCVAAAYYDREDDLGDGVAVGAAYLF